METFESRKKFKKNNFNFSVFTFLLRIIQFQHFSALIEQTFVNENFFLRAFFHSEVFQKS